MPELHKFDFYDKMIPKISSEELNRRLKLITPCVTINKSESGETIERSHMVEIKDADPKNAYKWDYKKGEDFGTIDHSGVYKRDKPHPSGGWYLKETMESVGEFVTLHGCGHPMLFKPSIEEVLAQLPAELFDEKKLAGRKLYFTNEILNEKDFMKTSMLSSYYHIAKTIVYIQTQK